jgi:hypothetical protein
MDTYKTLDQARAAKGEALKAIYGSYILCIEHKDNGVCYIGSKVNAQIMRGCLARKPMPEIIRVISEHDPRTDEQQAADKAKILAEAAANRKCERCGCHVSGDAYHQTERSPWGPVTAYYCDSCRQLLTQIGAGEHTAMQERAGDRPDNTPYTKED